VLFDDQYELSYEISSLCRSVACGDIAARRYPSCLSRHIAAHAPIIAKAVVSSCGEKPFSRRCWRGAPHIERVEQRASLSVRNTSTCGIVAAQHSPDIVFLSMFIGRAERDCCIIARR